MVNDIQLDFQLLDTDLEPKSITEKLEVTPDNEMLKGERNSKLVLPRVNIWSIRSKVDSDEVEDHWRYLSQLLVKHEEKIRDIAITGKALLIIIVNSENRIPPIIMPSSMVAFLGAVGAGIEIDHMQF